MEIMSKKTRNIVIRWLKGMGVSDPCLEQYDDEMLNVIAETVMLEHRLGL